MLKPQICTVKNKIVLVQCLCPTSVPNFCAQGVHPNFIYALFRIHDTICWNIVENRGGTAANMSLLSKKILGSNLARGLFWV